jgi:hypothetical protein
MLRDLQACSGQVVDLSPFAHNHRRVCRQRRLAAPTHHWPLLDDDIRRHDQPQCLPAMPQLSARLLATPPAQTARLARQAVTAGRLAAVVAILPQSRFQVAHPRQERLHLLTQCGVLGFQLGVLFIWRHVSTLLPQRKSA